MPKKNGKGGKGHRKAKSGGGLFRRELLFKEPGQEYAQITKMLGNGHCECSCYDGVVRLGNIRGKMRKRVWINMSDIILCGLRDYQDDKVDIIHKYTLDEVRNLQTMGELPSDIAIERSHEIAFRENENDEDDDDALPSMEVEAVAQVKAAPITFTSTFTHTNNTTIDIDTI
jgi:translation initiation factor 1A